MRTSKILTIIGILIAAVAVAFFIGWFASRESKPPGADSQAGTTAGSDRATTKPVEAQPSTPVVIEPIETNEPSTDIAAAKTNQTAIDWDEKFDEVFEDPNLDTDKMAEKMLAIYSHLKPEAQADAMGHILNLVPDEGFAPVGKILLNPKTPEGISDDIMNDMGNRPGTVRMPLLLQVAKMSNHPKAAEAKELLELYIEPDEDPGDDWDKWEKEMKKYLEENPD